MEEGVKRAGREMTIKELAAMDKTIKVTQDKTDKAEKAKATVKLELEQLKQELQLAEMKHRSETDGLRNSENRLKNTIEGLQQKNRSLEEMVDKSATSSQLFAGKQKDFELFKEISLREIKWFVDQHSFLVDYYNSEVANNQKKQLAELRDSYTVLKKECEILEQTEKELISKEEEESKQMRPRRESQSSDGGIESEISKIRANLAELSDFLKAKTKEKSDLQAGMHKEAVMQAFLRTESDELAIRARQHELELEEESRSVREEEAKLKRESIKKELRFHEIEKSNVELRTKKAKFEEDYELITKKLENLKRLSMDSNEGRKEKTGEDMKIVESLQIEKKELRGDLEKLVRTKQKLETTVKFSNDRLLVLQEDILLLANLIAQRENLDPASFYDKLSPEDNDRVWNALEQKSPFDQRMLIEKLSTENVELTKRLKLLEARSLMQNRKP